MKISKDLERGFIRAIQKEVHNRTKNEERAIDNRNSFIRSQFEWSREMEDKLLLLNKRLREEEMRVFEQYRQLEKHCQSMVNNREIKDFELEVEWSCWNENHYIKFDDSIEGNPFYSMNCVGDFMMHHTEEEYITHCFNTLREFSGFIPRNSPIITEPHCYMFHHLYDHCRELTWFDICNIDKVWIEIKVTYQFFSKI